MASNHTTNFSLSQWEENDEVLRADFNADNAKIDEALGTLETDLEAEAVRAKAVEAKRGNCLVVTGSYVGNGSIGSESPNYLSFSHRVLAVLLDGYYVLVRGSAVSYYTASRTTALNLSWGDKSVSWYVTNDVYEQCNKSGRTYYYTALLDAEH